MAWKPDYCTAEQVKAALHIEDTDDDALIAVAITAASRAIDDATGRQFGQVDTATARYYGAIWDRDLGRWIVRIDDLMDTTDLAVAIDDGSGSFGTALTLDTDYRLAPYNAAADGEPWTEIVGASGVSLPCEPRSVRVTALWGWSAVPDVVEQAAIIQASRFFMRRAAPFGVAGSPDVGSELRLLARLDPDVAVLVASVARLWGAV